MTESRSISVVVSAMATSHWGRGRERVRARAGRPCVRVGKQASWAEARSGRRRRGGGGHSTKAGGGGFCGASSSIETKAEVVSPLPTGMEKSAEMSCKLRPGTSDNERSMQTEPQRGGWAVHHRAELPPACHGHTLQPQAMRAVRFVTRPGAALQSAFLPALHHPYPAVTQ